MIKASIIIPSYNPKKTIKACLGSLASQAAKNSAEIIVVDSSNDGSASLIKAEFPSVKLTRLAKKTMPSVARNIGVKKARGKIIAFIDSDCIAEKNWLGKMLSSQESEKIVGGSVGNANPEKLLSWVSYLSEFSEFLPGNPKAFKRFVPTCNASYAKGLFEKHGFFPEIRASEDVLFNWKLVKGGEKVFFNPEIKVYHLNKTSLAAILENQSMLGFYSAVARKRENIEGKFFVRFFPLAAFLPFLRLARVFSRVLFWNQKMLPLFLAASPLILLAFFYWAFGFLQGVFEG